MVATESKEAIPRGLMLEVWSRLPRDDSPDNAKKQWCSNLQLRQAVRAPQQARGAHTHVGGLQMNKVLKRV
jgi:hypothetical protein